jgi:hypothetical protein
LGRVLAKGLQDPTFGSKLTFPVTCDDVDDAVDDIPWAWAL